MKFLRKIASYTNGVRLALAALALIMTVALIMGIQVVSQIRYIRSNYEIVSATTGDTDRLYYYMSTQYMYGGNTGKGIEIETLENLPGMEGVYPVYSVGSVSRIIKGKKEQTGIMLLHPRLLELFPDMGLKFSDPGGVILASTTFQDVDSGDSFELYFSKEKRNEEMTAVGWRPYPYRFMGFQYGGTKITVNDLFGPAQCLLMSATEDNLARMAELAYVTPSTFFIFEVEPHATPEQTEALLHEISRTGMAVSLTKLLADTESAMDEQLRELLPVPLFLVTVSTFAYFSTQILIFKKKEQDLAVSYLCGGTRFGCTVIALGAFGLVSLVPIGLSIGAVAILPVFDWLDMLTTGRYLIDHWTYGLLAGFFLLTQGITALAAWLDMKDHTPLTLLRGVEK